MVKRGAHAPPFLMTAPEGFKTFENIYGAENLVDNEDWLMLDQPTPASASGVRIITAAPELDGVMSAIDELHRRGIVFSIGHRYVLSFKTVYCHSEEDFSIATSDVATSAVYRGARLITHLFNAMPQLHHRDPSIIGLLGASPYLNPRLRKDHATSKLVGAVNTVASAVIAAMPSLESKSPLSSAGTQESIPQTIVIPAKSEAFDDLETPVLSPGVRNALDMTTGGHTPFNALGKASKSSTSVVFERPFYDIIVDGIHSHPNSVRVWSTLR